MVASKCHFSKELFSRAAVVDDALNGVITYTWLLGDTSIAGVYYAEFVVVWPGTRDQTYPPSGYLQIAIEPRL